MQKLKQRKTADEQRGSYSLGSGATQAPFGWGRRHARAQGLHPDLTVRSSHMERSFGGLGGPRPGLLTAAGVSCRPRAGLKGTLSCTCRSARSPSGRRARVRSALEVSLPVSSCGLSPACG